MFLGYNENGKISLIKMLENKKLSFVGDDYTLMLCLLNNVFFTSFLHAGK